MAASNWYQETIIYELHVRSFADGNGDGIGDFRGLVSRLDYLERLGVGAIWLLPFYPSPLRDDGYDIADYTDVHPDYGTLADFRHFLREAHARGLKVITELVLNHTSDQHPWFKRACAAPAGSLHRNFYVWGDNPDKYREARIIFKDFETSNWTWNSTAQAYYWHRFYSHQPDLNFDIPQVRKTMLKIVDFWLGMGVDGLRLDAVPYLIEREGSNCENLPETHAYLKELRAHVDAKFPGRMLLAEANQWPEEAVAYFGKGDECHMAFHFPLMPRIFMSMWVEDRHPIIDIMEQTPAIPEGCQWGLFLRNHDELTLEMISDEERDYMYHAYARDSKARINLGIRRRLAPLMQNDRAKMELINVLLFSFPGTPIIYYGDEIGMGDNYYLGDRNGVRTPMQWTPERNAGFSQANPQALFLPLVIDAEYHYESVNVEMEERSSSSFLWWMRRLISVYRANPVLGRGSLSFVKSENTRVLSLLRTYGEEHVLVAANLSRFAQAVSLDLGELAGWTPVDVFGQSRFPAIGKEPYSLTLGPHTYYWLRLEPPQSGDAARETYFLPTLSYTDNEALFLTENSTRLENLVLPALLARNLAQYPNETLPRRLRIMDTLNLRGQHVESGLVLTEDPDTAELQNTHVFLLGALVDRRAENVAESEESAIAKLKSRERLGRLVDGFQNSANVRDVINLMASGRKRHGRSGNFHAQVYASKLLRSLLADQQGPVRHVRTTPYTCTHSINNSIYLKFYKRPTEGVNPEMEMLAHLADNGFDGVPRLLASLSWQNPLGGAMSLVAATEYIAGAVDGKDFTKDSIVRFLDAVLASGLPAPEAIPEDPTLPHQVSPEQLAMVDAYAMDFFTRLGQRTGKMHTVLGSLNAPGMTAEPISKFYLRSIYQTARSQIYRVKRGLERLKKKSELLESFPEKRMQQSFNKLLQMEPTSLRIRVHGDFRLANVLHTGKDFVLANFDGDARLSVNKRSSKRTALHDVASMLFSISFTAEKALIEYLALHSADRAYLAPWLSLWRHGAAVAFLRGYGEATLGAPFLPTEQGELRLTLEISLFEHILMRLERCLKESPEDLPVIFDITNALLRIFA